MIKNNALLLKKPEFQENFKNYEYNGDYEVKKEKVGKVSDNKIKFQKDKKIIKKISEKPLYDYFYKKGNTIDISLGRKQ